MYLNSFLPSPSNVSEDRKCILTYVDQTQLLPERSQKVSEHALIKPLQCHQAHKMHINLCWPIPTHVSENTKKPINLGGPNLTHTSENIKCYSTFLATHLPYYGGHNMHLNMCHPNLGSTQNVSQLVLNETQSMQPNTKNASQYVMIKPIPCQ
jgi:hypothetical protein